MKQAKCCSDRESQVLFAQMEVTRLARALAKRVGALTPTQRAARLEEIAVAKAQVVKQRQALVDHLSEHERPTADAS